MHEHEVRALLIRATEDRPPELDLVAGLPAGTTARPRRERRPVRALAPLVAVGVAAAAVASAILLAVPLSEPSAQAEVATAVDNTSRQSYRVHGTSGGRAIEGTADPVRRLGVITVVGEGRETRFVGDLMYVRNPDTARWEVYPRVDLEPAHAPLVLALVKFAALDPQRLLLRLRSATDVRSAGSASGDGWNGKQFSFSVVDADSAKRPDGRSETLTGAVAVDDQDRVRRLQIDFGITGQRIAMEFSDFGTPVTVTAPPAAEVDQSPAEKGVDTTDKPVGASTKTAPSGNTTGKKP